MKNNDSRKVLVVIEGGMAYVYAESGIRVAIADMDNLQVEHDERDIAVHSDFSRLIKKAGITFPTSKLASANDAEVF